MPLNLKNLSYTYAIKTPQEKKALDDITLSFEDHCFTALIGKTGSGKSTLIQHLNALLLPTSGIVELNDHVIDMSLVYRKNGKINQRAMKRKHKKKSKTSKKSEEKSDLSFSSQNTSSLKRQSSRMFPMALRTSE